MLYVKVKCSGFAISLTNIVFKIYNNILINLVNFIEKKVSI